MTLSVVFAKCLREELVRRGIEPQPAFARARIDPARLATPQARLSFDEARDLYAVASGLSRDPAFGLSAGTRVPLHALQLVGYLVLSQASIQAAVPVLDRFSSLLVDGLRWSVQLEDEVASVRFALPAALASDRCAADFTLALAVRLCRTFMTSSESLRFVHLQGAKPAYADRYEASFRCPAYFDRSTYAVGVPRAQFEHAQAHADPVLRTLYEQSASTLLAEHRRVLGAAHRVQSLLRSENDIAKYVPDEIARQLGMSLRTLRRRLSEEGTSLRAQLDDARHWHARRRLQTPGTPLKQLAAELGFSETTAFHRAFRRWTGITPAAYASLRPSEGEPAALGP
jgi:AraC-like DNA-binding protein